MVKLWWLCLAVLSTYAVVVLADLSASGIAGSGRVVVCYVAAWAVYRPGKGSFSLDNLDPSLCTHLVYAFAGLNATTNSIRSLDPYHDLEDGKGAYRRMTSLRNRYPHLKVTLAIGGWNEGSTNYSLMAGTPSSRQTFISSVTDFIRKYDFDGLDLDWEFPTKRGGNPADKQNFVHLVKELRQEFNKYGWLLTAAFGVGPDTIDEAYDIQQLSHYLDYIHAMCYDYHGSWDRVVGHNAPLQSHIPEDKLNVEYSIKYYLKLGAPAKKLVLGLPLYGRTFLLKETGVSVLGAATEEKGFQGPYTREDGFMGYNEICTEMSKPDSTWESRWDEHSSTPYAVQDNKVITYDDTKSIAEKVKFALKLDLAGVMVWSIDTDDFHGDCPINNDNDGVSGNFPIMRTISRTVLEFLQAKKDAEHKHDHDHNQDHSHDHGQNITDEKGSSASCNIATFLFLLFVVISSSLF